MNERFSPRLVVYGMGFVGQRLVRLAHQKGWPVVAAYNRAGDKVGVDIGQLAGLGEDLGVVVEDADNLPAAKLDADVALIATTDSLQTNYAAYEPLLSAGINVLCHGTESYNPWFENNSLAEKIQQLAADNKVTFTGGGIWDMTRIWSGVMAAGPCVDIQSMTHTSQTEAARQGVKFLPMLGAGLSVEEHAQRFADADNPFTRLFHIPIYLVSKKLGYTFKSKTARAEPVVIDEDVYCPYSEREYPAGMTLGTRFIVELTTEEDVTFRSAFEYRVFRPGEDEVMCWKVEGTPGMEVRVLRRDSDIASASSLFNRVPDIMAAQPGIVGLADMMPLSPTALQ